MTQVAAAVDRQAPWVLCCQAPPPVPGEPGAGRWRGFCARFVPHGGRRALQAFSLRPRSPSLLRARLPLPLLHGWARSPPLPLPGIWFDAPGAHVCTVATPAAPQVCAAPTPWRRDELSNRRIQMRSPHLPPHPGLLAPAVGTPRQFRDRAPGDVQEHLSSCNQHLGRLLPLISMNVSLQVWPQSLKFIKRIHRA